MRDASCLLTALRGLARIRRREDCEVAGVIVQGSSLKHRSWSLAGTFATLPGPQRGFVAVGQSPSGSSRLARDRAADLSLMFALLVAAATAGGGIYEAFVLFPTWSGSPAGGGGVMAAAGSASIPLTLALEQFWVVCYGATAVSLLLALGFNWESRWRRAMVLLALVAFAAVRGWTYVSLRPELEELLGATANTLASSTLIDHVVSWSAQNRWRGLIDCLVVFLLALAFRSSARIIVPAATRAPGAYRKAAK
jgi:hypothetical protein